ncbi:MAG: transglutaminase domain-containing protein [Bacilli bacterium]|nr:transglutaminase domain-containing protein [Bacilli bacterium]
MKQAEKIVDEIINSVPSYCEDDELKIFTYIYVKVANLLEYDNNAAKLIDMHLAGYDRDKANEHVIDPASTIECLIKGRALCSGYASVLTYILNKLGIETITVTIKSDHQWNQVKINGTWYNCDLTNDSDFILSDLECPHFLKSNDDDNNFSHSTEISSFHECKTSISAELQEQLINEAKKYINEIENKDKLQTTKEITDNEKEKKEPKFIKIIKTYLTNKKGVVKK